MVMPRRRYLMGFLAAAGLAGTLTACGGSNAAQSAAGLSCLNYSIQGSGQYHNEVAVRVHVKNSTTHQARYTVRVDLTGSGDSSGTAPVHVMLTGSVASGASAVLARRVLTTDRVQACRVAWITPLVPA